MEAFRYRADELHCEQVPLQQLVNRYGAPLYVYSQTHIVGQLQQLDAAFCRLDRLICFAVKANSNLAVIRALARAGAGFDTVSGGELRRVVEAGGDPQRLRRIPAPGLAAQGPAQAFDLGGGPMTEIGQGAFADLGAHAGGFPQEDGRG